jgi:endonuclease/exonuclease/phosphatase family metal-dependent hydrolase
MAGLRIYSIITDEYRDATQADLDQLQAVERAYGRLRARIDEDHAQLQAELKLIRSKAGEPA